MRCLGQRTGSARVFACGDAFLDGFNLGYSDDGAQSFQPLVLFPEGGPPGMLERSSEGLRSQLSAPAHLSGPLTCPQVQTACASHWAALQKTLGITPADAGGPQADGGSSAGSSHCGSADASTLAVILVLAFTLRQRRAAERRR